MMEQLRQNGGTVLVCLIVLAIVVLCVAHLIREKKAGKGGCSCGCGNCPSNGICHSKHP